MIFLKKNFDWISCIVLALVFVVFPQVDLTVSGWFYDSTSGTWAGSQSALVDSIYAIFRYIPYFLVPVLLLVVGISFLPQGLKKHQRGVWIFLLVSLLAGPGILVHTVFKDVFDRARPKNIEQFDGHKSFTPAFVINNECRGGCNSFVSGHAAMGFWFMAFAWTLRSRLWFCVGLGTGVVVSYIRIVDGGHFLSDTIMSGYLCYFTFKLLARYILDYSFSR